MFNPNDHMIKLKGKEYLQVAWRLVWFREDHPDFGINTQALSLTEDHAIFKATITDANGIQLSAGHGSESKRDFGDFIEKAETKAIGRALAMLGYGTQFAADELDEGERIVDSPINRAKSQSLPDDAQKPAETPKPGAWNPMVAASKWAKENGVQLVNLNKMREALISAAIIPNVDVMALTPEQFDQLIKAIEANYADMLRKPA